MTDSSSEPPRRNIPIASPCTGEEEWEALREPIFSGWLTQGPKVAEFERRFADRHGVAHAVATTSCTTALHLALVAMDVGTDDEVIVPSFTWVATANAVLYCGATPVLVDVDTRTMNIDPGRVAARLGPRTKAIIAVHLFGLCADIDALEAVAGDIPILEDAACAAGAEYRGRPAGSLGIAAAFSFHPRKAVTTGEGGMITTDDDELAARAVALRNHGADVPEEVRHSSDRPYLLPRFGELGFNYRMTDLQAAVGLVQLSKLDRFVAERARWAAYYDAELRGVPWLRTPAAAADSKHSYQSYVCQVDPDTAPMDRDEILATLESKGIGARPGTHAVHTLDLYRRRYGFADGDFPAAFACDRWSLAIPLHNRMSAEDFRYVVEVLRGL